MRFLTPIPALSLTRFTRRWPQVESHTAHLSYRGGERRCTPSVSQRRHARRREMRRKTSPKGEGARAGSVEGVPDSPPPRGRMGGRPGPRRSSAGTKDVSSPSWPGTP